MAQHTWYKVHGTANSLLKRPVHTKSKVVGKEVLSLTLTLDLSAVHRGSHARVKKPGQSEGQGGEKG